MIIKGLIIMFTKRNLFIALFLIMVICTISHVSATDFNATDEIVNNDNQIDIKESIANNAVDEKNNVNKAISQNDENSLSSDMGTFTDLQNIFDTYYVYNFDRDYYFDSDIDDENLHSGVEVNDEITIYGNGHTIYGNGARTLWIYSGAQVTIHDLNFENIYTDEYMSSEFTSYNYGGAIHNSGTLLLYGCSFSYNHAYNDGGAIYVSGNGILMTSDCDFINNTVSEDFGGAISADGELYVSDCNFYNCHAGFGGAISSAKESYIYDSIFSGNEAKTSGGAIFNYLENICNVEDSYFSGNSATYGGAIYNAIAVDCYFFDDNYASSEGHNIDDGVNLNCTAEDSYSKNFENTIMSTGFVYTPSTLVYAQGTTGKTFDITVTSKPNGEKVKGVDVKLVIDGDEDKYLYYKSSDENGLASFSLPTLSYGVHKFTVNFVHKYYNNLVSNYSVQVGEFDSEINFSAPVSFDYGSSGSTTISLKGCTVSQDYISVLNHPEADVRINNNVITVSGLNAGTYTLQVVTTPSSEIYKSVTKTTSITVNKVDSSIIFSNDIAFYYKQSGSTTVALYGCTINSAGVSVVGHSEIVPVVTNNNQITVSGLEAGVYTLSVVTTPDANHKSSIGTCSIVVTKLTAQISASSCSVVYKSGKTWSIRLTDTTNNKPIANKKITLKVYTGSSSKNYYVTTNSNGVATFKASDLAVGTHKVILSISDSLYNCDPITSQVKVTQIKLSYKVLKDSVNGGTVLTIKVMDKSTKKYLKGVKIKLVIYTGSKITKTVTLKSTKIGNYYGVGYATNALSKGSHKVKIMPADSNKYTGSASSTIKITKKGSWIQKKTG